MSWVGWLILGIGIVAASWTVLIVLAHCLPPGLAKDLAGFLPACATTLRRLRKDPRVPRRAKVAVPIADKTALSVYRRRLDPIVEDAVGPMDDLFGTV